MKAIVNSRKMRRKGILELIKGKEAGIYCLVQNALRTNDFNIKVVSISIPH